MKIINGLTTLGSAQAPPHSVLRNVHIPNAHELLLSRDQVVSQHISTITLFFRVNQHQPPETIYSRTPSVWRDEGQHLVKSSSQQRPSERECWTYLCWLTPAAAQLWRHWELWCKIQAKSESVFGFCFSIYTATLIAFIHHLLLLKPWQYPGGLACFYEAFETFHNLLAGLKWHDKPTPNVPYAK